MAAWTEERWLGVTTRAPRDLPDHTRCTARTKASGGTARCGQPRMQGTTVCRMHGGSARQVRSAAGRRLAADKARRALDEIEVREVENPLDELRRLTGEVVAWKDALASHVAALEDRFRFTDDKGAEQLRAEVALYERALDRAGKFLELWARLGLDAMLAQLRVRVTEAQAAAMSRGLDAYRLAAGVDDAEHRAGLAAMAKAMRG